MSPLVLAAIAASGLLAGFAHVLSGPDHLAAMAPFAVNAKTRAWRSGVRWGFGHSAGVLGVGVLALLLRDALDIDLLSAWGERCVGVILLCIGAWGFASLVLSTGAKTGSRGRHSGEEAHQHHHPAFAVGTVHGLAGSSHFLGIVPALALPSDLAAAVYLALFGLGSIAAMGTFSSLIGWIADRPSASGLKMQSVFLGVSSTVAIVVGATWLLSGD